MRRKGSRSSDPRRARIIAATLLCLLSVLTVCMHANWTTRKQRFTVGFYAGRLSICVRDLTPNSFDQVLGPGRGVHWGWGPFRPRFRGNTIGYPRDSWYGLPVAVPLFAASAGYLIYTLAFARRRDPLTTCGRCGYSLTGLSSHHCPECGTPV